ncbi:MarC family protein [Curvivirga sp.]|uniref:MarC family protein n=1 Tax=Curvivirga sp. TaxID=2856848 RepID=UPI003B59330C
MFETALVSFTTFFAVIGPFDVAALFAALTANATGKERRSMAIKGVLIATGVLLLFAVFGKATLNLFGISLPALKIAGGILLLLISIDLVFARHSGANSTTKEENKEAEKKQDISVFPLATPLIAGPGSIGAVILLMAETHGDYQLGSMVVLGMVGILIMTLVLLLVATQVQKLLGVTGLQVVSRVVGVLLAALAVQFVLDGVEASNLLSSIPGISSR